MHLPTSQAAVLIVEDEPVTRALVAGCLTAAGHRVTALESAQQLLALHPSTTGHADGAALEAIDLFVLDIELPDGDGYSLARWVRERSQAGIIFLSRRAAPVDRVRGLDLGADDFIVKPPDIDELVARVRAVLRRRRPAPRRVVLDGWRFEPDRFELTSPAGEVSALTAGEAGVLALIVAAGGRVVERDALREALAGEGPNNPRSLDVLMHRLRRKLGEGGNVIPRILLTVHGVGYRLGVDVQCEA